LPSSTTGYMTSNCDASCTAAQSTAGGGSTSGSTSAGTSGATQTGIPGRSQILACIFIMLQLHTYFLWQ
jgi:hypothetical protein